MPSLRSSVSTIIMTLCLLFLAPAALSASIAVSNSVFMLVLQISTTLSISLGIGVLRHTRSNFLPKSFFSLARFSILESPIVLIPAEINVLVISLSARKHLETPTTDIPLWSHRSFINLALCNNFALSILSEGRFLLSGRLPL